MQIPSDVRKVRSVRHDKGTFRTGPIAHLAQPLKSLEDVARCRAGIWQDCICGARSGMARYFLRAHDNDPPYASRLAERRQRALQDRAPVESNEGFDACPSLGTKTALEAAASGENGV